MQERPQIFRRDLQGLRALAIALVVLGHSGLGIFSGGFIGVDVFFVLSGFLISGLLIDELESNGRIQLLDFYARRLKRLLPALTLMLVTTSLMAFWLLSPSEISSQLSSSVYAATWTSNLYFTFNTLGYFDELANRDLFTHTWSLAVEEQFYLVWPLLLLGLTSLWGRVQAQRGGILITALGVVFVLSLALSVYWSAQAPLAGFYLMPSRIWQFSLGALVYLVSSGVAAGQSESNPNTVVVHRIAVAFGAVLILASSVGFNEQMSYPGWWALVPSLGAALVIWGGRSCSNGVMATAPLVWLGDRSYSLYLWHWPVLILGFSLGFKGDQAVTIGLLALSLGLSIVSYRWVELPFWKGGLSRASTPRILVIAVLVMAAVVAGSVWALRHTAHEGERIEEFTNRWHSDLPAIYSMPCDAWYAHSRVEPCVFAAETPSKTVVLLGDSILAQWFSAIAELYPPPKWRLVVLTKSSCAMSDIEYFYPRIKRLFTECTEWRNGVLKELETIKPDVVIVGNAATYDFSESDWVEGGRRFYQSLSEVVSKVFVVQGTPSLGFDGPGCIARHVSEEGQILVGECLAEGRLDLIAPALESVRRAVEGIQNVQLLDLNPLVCPGGVCSAVSREGYIVFRDSQHLTDTFVRSRAPAIRELLQSLGEEP